MIMKGVVADCDDEDALEKMMLIRLYSVMSDDDDEQLSKD